MEPLELTEKSGAPGTYLPRLRDLRHSFAVHSIEQWLADAAMLDRILPLLVTYMGNTKRHGMERYLELCPIRFTSQLARLASC
jgi:hypothetical protein